ncbi:MAG: hypothetical protein ACKO14_02605 [Armatimonadota bacterium]
MTLLRYISQSLRYRWTKSIWFAAGIMLSAIVITGSLAIGDSVRRGLADMVDARLGNFSAVMVAGEHHFRDSLAGSVALDGGIPTAPVLALKGAVTQDSADTARLRAGDTSVYGIDARFLDASGAFANWQLRDGPVPLPIDDTATINSALARAAGLKVGDEVILSVEKPTLLSRDAPLATIDDAVVTFRVKVGHILKDSELGRFGLAANQLAPRNIFVDVKLLQKQVGLVGRINMLLFGKPARGDVNTAELSKALFRGWDIEDADLEVRSITVAGKQRFELRTGRVFLDPHVADAGLSVRGAEPALTTFVNRLTKGTVVTPYSMVTATDTLGPIPSGGIVINQWLADDQNAKVGDDITLDYWVLGANRELVRKTTVRKVTKILPMAGIAADRELMPILPGLSDKKDCREWEPGVPIDLELLRDKDQAYWEKFKGTPKAFVSLSDGQALWGNRFGNLTAIRFTSPPNTLDGIRAQLRRSINPAALGMFVRPLRSDARASASGGLDFGGLFLALGSFLLISAALLIKWMVDATLEERKGERTVLAACGVTAAVIRRMFTFELVGIAIIASLIGSALFSRIYTDAVGRALAPLWDTTIPLRVSLVNIATGVLSSVVIGTITVVIALRPPKAVSNRQRKRVQTPLAPGVVTSVLGGMLWLPVFLYALSIKGAERAEFLMMAGMGFFVLLLGVFRLWANRVSRTAWASTVWMFSLRRLTSNLSALFTSMSVVGLATFLIIAVGANKQLPPKVTTDRASGTGGYTFIASSALPLYGALESKAEADRLALSTDTDAFSSLPIRVREGDDASCLNLNKPTQPQIIGLDAARLAAEKRFPFAGSAAGGLWTKLKEDLQGGEIPVIADENTIMWSLQSAVGKSLTLLGDQGQPVRCRIVGMLKRTVLQGAVIMDEARFVQLFPLRSGYRMFLIEAKGSPESEVGTALTDAGEPFGLSLTRTTDRMAEYATVENTYLSVFAALGGLGLLMGLAGTGIIVRRQLLATAKETALLQSLGISMDVIQQIRGTEHAFGGLVGLLIGLLSALWASVDTLAAQPMQVTILSLAVLVSVGGIILLVVRSTVRQLVKQLSLTAALSRE